MTEQPFEKTRVAKPLSKEVIEWFLSITLRLPMSWLLIGSVFLLLSMVDGEWASTTGLSLTFHVTTITALFFALIWLPALLRVFALLGGGIKTPMGEISNVPGISILAQWLDTDTIGSLLDSATTAQEQGSTQQKILARQILQELQEAYLGRIPLGEAREEMHRLAHRYNEVREHLPASKDRTREMASIAERMRVLAPFASFSEQEINSFLHSADGGERLLGLSVVSSTKQVTYFDDILHIVDNPQSGYEQYQALRSLEQLLPLLNNVQKKRLQEALKRIPSDSHRAYLKNQLLSAIS